MKNVKKLLSIVMVLTLVLSLGASALAVDVTISDAEDANSTYTAYPLLTATYSDGLYQYSLNPTFNDALAAGLKAIGHEIAITEANKAEILQVLSEMTTEQTRTFADAAYEVIRTNPAMQAAGVKASEKTFKDLSGYYLIAETVNADEEGTATSLVMLQAVGEKNITVNVKEDHPSSEKKVKDKNDSNPEDAATNGDWRDSADYDVNDHVPYQLRAKMINEHYADYKTYTLKFVDTISQGLTYDAGSTKVYWLDAEGNEHVLSKADPTFASYAGDKEEYEGGSVLTWDLGDIKSADTYGENAVPAGATVYVEYTATLSDKSVIGVKGNPNEMHIEYSNNPYEEGTGKTPDDKVIVFTYDLDVSKVDGEEEPLPGATFSLYKKVPAGTAGAVALDEKGAVKESAEESEKTWLPVTLSKNADGNVFTAQRIDDGEYKLVEDEAPDGYNKAGPWDFTVSATHTDGDAPSLSDVTGNDSFKFTKEPAEGAMGKATIVNETGVELPETGGIGTTIFYIVGAVLVAGAVILLVTKKRVSGAEK